ncbi:MAG: PA14 domain-containing protein, partial [Bacteroidota bacterium]
PLAKNLKDSAGVQLIADWINSMSPNPTINGAIEVANYRDDFNGTTPAVGWSYLWNDAGPIGNASNYTGMLPTGAGYDSDGAAGVPDGTNLAWGNFSAVGGHTGPSAGQGQAVNRYVIAAYTVAQAGDYELEETEYSDANGNCGDGAVVEVYVNNTLITSSSFPNGGSTTFDTSLGTLNAGDVIYVAAGPGNNHDFCDGFTWDFSISRIENTTKQRILFPEIPAAHVNDGPISLGATASSNLAIAYTVVSGPATVAGNTLTLTGQPGYITVRASQAGNGSFAAAPDVERTFSVAPVGSGDGAGLLGTYFHNADKTDIAFYRNDAELDFYWGSGSPDPGIEYNSFSIVWEGEIEAPVSGLVSFLATADDGVRLFVNNQLIIDEWQDQARTTHSGSINMTAWQRVPIRMEFYEAGAYASARLEWTASDLTRETVPSEFLYPAVESSFPVEWLGFDAVVDGGAVLLDWQTGAEVNSDYFVVERSADGENFEALGQQPAAGYSEEARRYQDRDLAPLAGESFYRIQAVDLDGSFSYSEVRAIRLEATLIRVYPTPLQANRILQIETLVSVGTPVRARLLDLKGQSIREARWTATGEATPHAWNLAELASGVYVLEVQAGAKRQLVKVRL